MESSSIFLRSCGIPAVSIAPADSVIRAAAARSFSGMSAGMPLRTHRPANVAAYRSPPLMKRPTPFSAIVMRESRSIHAKNPCQSPRTMAALASANAASGVSRMLPAGGCRRGRLRRALLLLLLDHRRDVREQGLGVVDDPVLDRVLHAADMFRLAGLVVEADGAGAVEHLEVLQRVLIDDHHVGEQPG